MTVVTILFARRGSVYHRLAVDVWDKERDARQWPGGGPVVAHPPCRAWGSLRGLARPAPDEPQLAIWAVDQVRRWGGVLEHPARSLLWTRCGMPRPGAPPDAHGGWTYAAPQFWWGHRANKATWFYIVGCAPNDLPPVPLKLGEATHTVSAARRVNGRKWRPELSRAGREATPPALAHWLVELAGRCHV